MNLIDSYPQARDYFYYNNFNSYLLFTGDQ